MSLQTATLVTGASSGIGRDVAIRLSQNRRLVLQGRDVDRLNETRRLCTNSASHHAWPIDLSEVVSLELKLAHILRNEHLSITEFVHCAGTLDVLPLRLASPKVVQRIIDVNFCSAVEIVRVLSGKRHNQSSLKNVVLVSSTASRYGAKGFNIYSASKGALDAFMRSVAVELAPKVRVNSVLPGAVRTAMSAKIFEDSELASGLAAEYPLGIGETKDVVGVIAFLLSEDARWITGQQIVVDGGRTINISARHVTR